MGTDLKKMLGGYDIAIGYEPMDGEADYRDCPQLAPVLDNVMLLPQAKEENPLMWAAKLKKELIDQEVCIIVPGRRFDRAGTRHGRGFGWYDRFLYSVPPRWLRIGVTDSEHLFDEPLPRQPWDELMDYLMVKTADGWETIETKARL